MKRREFIITLMSEESRIALLLGAMEDVFLSHVDTLSGISEILETTPEEEKRDMSWTLGWNMSRMQGSLLSAASALCREMERLGLEAPALELEVERPAEDPEEFIHFWTDHLLAQAALLRFHYHEVQALALGQSEDDLADDFWDESLKDLLKKYRE